MKYPDLAVNKKTHMILRYFTCLILTFVAWSANSSDSTGDTSNKNIRVAEYLQSDTALSIFVSALQKSSHWSEIKAAEAITLFVPGDAALRDEGSAFLLQEVLQKPENKSRLDELIALHVVANELVLEHGSAQTKSVKTIAGSCLTVENLNAAVKIGPEAVLKKSIETGNGRIYQIDRLLWVPYKDELNDEAVTDRCR